jgi:hypothetical protein
VLIRQQHHSDLNGAPKKQCISECSVPAAPRRPALGAVSQQKQKDLRERDTREANLNGIAQVEGLALLASMCLCPNVKKHKRYCDGDEHSEGRVSGRFTQI